jgi:NACalpha-BTF3-like transcription factor
MDKTEKKDPNREDTNIKQDSSGNVWTEEHRKIIKYVCSKTNLTEMQAYNGLVQHNGNYHKVIEIATAHHLVGVVMRQTNYTFQEAVEKLKKHKGEPVDVIKEFMGTENVKKKKIEAKTTNQMVFHEIRNFMDDVNKGYDMRKRRADKIKQIQEIRNK